MKKHLNLCIVFIIVCFGLPLTSVMAKDTKATCVYDVKLPNTAKFATYIYL